MSTKPTPLTALAALAVLLVGCHNALIGFVMAFNEDGMEYLRAGLAGDATRGGLWSLTFLFGVSGVFALLAFINWRLSAALVTLATVAVVTTDLFTGVIDPGVAPAGTSAFTSPPNNYVLWALVAFTSLVVMTCGSFVEKFWRALPAVGTLRRWSVGLGLLAVVGLLSGVGLAVGNLA